MPNWQLLSLGERPFVLECDRELPPDQQVVWFIRPLTSVEKERVKNYGSFNNPTTGETRLAAGTIIAETLKAGLVRVENLKYRDGTALEVPRRHDDRDGWAKFFTPIPDYVLSDVFVEINRISELTREQQGNSASPSNARSGSAASVPPTGPDAPAE